MSSTHAAPAEPAPRRTGLVALLVLLLGVAAALGAQTIVSYRRARQVEELVGRGQAVAIQRAVTPMLRHDVDDALLARLLDAHRADGLRYLAVIEPRGGIRAAAGVSVEPATVTALPARPGAIEQRFGATYRLYSPPPPRHPPGGPPPGPGPGLARDGRPPGPPPGGPLPFVLEVTPTAGAALRTEATRSLVVGLASTVALCGLALLLVRWVRHRERLEARLAQDRRLAALGQMSAVLAHEIRNPLASLKGHAQLLVENLGERGHERDLAKATRVVDEAVRLERLTNDLLELARTGRIERAPCDPASVLTAAAEGLDPARITIDRAGAPPRWSLDAGRMGQVLSNLLANALEAAPGEVVTATVTAAPGGLVYRIRDRGPGLPAGGLAPLLEPFHTTRVKGVGLGLAVAHRLVTLHGGTLAGRTHPEGGAELTVTVPAGSA